MPFEDVNNSLYNALSQNLGLKAISFLLFQPANPVLETNDLWNHYFNLIPPKSILSNPILSPGAQFFDNYCALNSALQSTPFQTLPEIRKGFQAFLRAQPTPPPVSRYPALFREWASRKASPLVAIAASAALALALKDPVADGQLRLMPYLGDPSANPPVPPKQPDWTGTFEQLQSMLAAGPPVSFRYKFSEVSKDVSKTWSKGRSAGILGLSVGATRASMQSLRFAQSDFILEASFAHVCTFPAAPGPWFSPLTLGLAFANKNRSPWIPGNPVTWESTFDEDKGNLARFLVNLIAVDTMNVRVTSLARFTKEEQSVVNANAGQGFWPFYATPGPRRLAISQHRFDAAGQMEIITTSVPGVAMILGGNIVEAGAFVTSSKSVGQG